MESLQENTLTYSIDPPWWITKIKFFNEIWHNPVFQRRFRKATVKRSMSIRAAFITGIAFGLGFYLILMGIMRWTGMQDDSVWALFYLPVIATGYALIRYLGNITLTIMTEMKGEYLKGEAEPILTTPQSSRDIFMSECMAVSMRGFGAIEEIVAFLTGLTITITLIVFLTLDYPFSYKFLYLVLGCADVLIVIAICVEVLVLIVYTAALHSLSLNKFWGTLVTILHLCIDFIGVNIIGALIFNLFSAITSGPFITGIMKTSELAANALGLLFFLIILTGIGTSIALFINIKIKLGTNRLEKFRRPGHYTDDTLLFNQNA